MKSFIVLSLFLGSQSALRLNQQYATGMNGDEDLGEDIIMKGAPFHYNQGKPASLLQLNSKWVELPDCGYGTLGADEVPLASDLSNAIIATCKGYDPLKQAPERFPEPVPTAQQTYQEQWGKNYTYWQAAPVFDPIFLHKTPLQDHEHQIVILQHGHIDPTPASNGPAADWYMHGKPLADSQWVPKTLVQIYQDKEDPSEIQVIQLEKEDKGKWVELPDCDGSAGEKPLRDGVANASWATCKVNPNVSHTGKKREAAEALDSMTPKAEK